MKVNSQVIVIAEAGVNHNGTLTKALELVDAAADSGADIIKFQTFKSESLVSKFAQKAKYQIENTQSNESQLEMIKKLELSHQDHILIKKHCEKRGIEFLSTAFEAESLKFLVSELGIKRIKVPSGEIINLPFLLEMAHTRLPILLSTGMATMDEIRTALNTLSFGWTYPDRVPQSKDLKNWKMDSKALELLKKHVCILHCVSNYPAPPEAINLKAMLHIQNEFGLPIGYSDHTLGIAAPIAAVALGARVIEKHFTLDRALPGPDHLASLEPGELKLMVQEIRSCEKLMRGDGLKRPSAQELETAKVARKSIVAGQSLKKGDIFSRDNIAIKRPGSGIKPEFYWDLLGKKASRDYEADELISETLS